MRVLLLLALSLNSFAKGEDHFIRVQGECYKKVMPDKIKVDYTVEVLKSTIDASSTEATQKYEKIRNAVKSMKLKDLEMETSEFSTRPLHEWEKRKKIFKGYQTRIKLDVYTSEIKKAGELLKLGANLSQDYVSGPHPHISTKHRQNEYKKCLSIASMDATEKAKILAKSLGAKLGSAFQINESYSQVSPTPMPMYRGAMMDAAMAESAGGAQIEFKKQEFKVKLEVFYKIK